MNAKASGSRLLVEATPSWQLEEADDPEDWDESFSFLKELDATLRCDVCYVSTLFSYDSKAEYRC